MDVYICLTLVVLVWIDKAVASVEKITFDQCFRNVDYVTDKDRFIVEWDGYSQTDTNCGITFHGHDTSEVLDKYKTCIKVTTFNVHSSNVVLKYYSDKIVNTDKLKGTFTSSNPPPSEWCSESEEYVEVKLYSPNTEPQQSVVLEAYGVMTYDYSKFVTAVVGGVFGGLAGIALIVTIIICVVRSRK